MKKLIITLAAAGLVSFGSAVMAEDAAPAGDVEAGKAAYESTCVGCHGAQGEGGVGPKLAGQSAKDIADKLHKYKNGEQVGPMTSMMAPMAAGLSDDDINNIAAFIATLQQ